MTISIRFENFNRISTGVKPDAKKRVVLPKQIVEQDITYHIYSNAQGQILLDPQVTIPASEAWIFKDKKILDSMDKSMTESSNGQTIDRGSFAKYVIDES